MKVQILIFALIQGALSYYTYPDFKATPEYIKACTKITSTQFNSAFKISDLYYNKARGNVKLDAIFCFEGYGSPSALFSENSRQPTGGDAYIKYSLDTPHGRSDIQVNGNSCSQMRNIPIPPPSKMVYCINLELEDYQKELGGYGRATYSMLNGLCVVDNCFTVSQGSISKLKFMRLSSTLNTDVFYINCPNPNTVIPCPTCPKTPINLNADIKQHQSGKTG